MIEAIKARLWECLAAKDVSLAMMVDRGGQILWSRGRTIHGRTVGDADGFPKSLIEQTIAAGHEVRSSDVVVTASGGGLPESARALYLKSLLVMPVERGFYLYLDSGSKVGFSDAEIEVFRVLTELLGEALASARSRGDRAGGVAGSSPAMEAVRNAVVSYALEDEPVLLTGPTGVGKNHVAELLHHVSGRRGRLVVAHCPSIPDGLFESEMFGHRRGAFTGALQDRTGLVQEAHAGTLLLDEVSEVPPAVQAKLLAFAETRRYRVIGDPAERTAEVRLVAASNRDLAEEVRAGRFRSDLYYRLNVLPVAIPPLRERPEDIADLVEHHRHLLRGKSPGPAFLAALAAHPWPGNVRELVQVLKRAAIRLPGPELGAEVRELLMDDVSDVSGQAGAVLADVEAALAEGANFWDSAWRAFLDRDLNRTELRALLERRYRETGGSLRRLSETLNLPANDYPRFVSALHKYAVRPDRD